MNIRSTLTLSATALAILVAFAACVTDTGNAGKDARARATNQTLREAGRVLGKVAVATLYTAATQEANGGKADFQQAAAGALWANVNAASTAGAVNRIVSAHSGRNAPETASAAANAAGGNVTPEKVAAIAAVISAATGAPPLK